MIDLFLVYQFIRRLATPFKEWDAYKLGIIDERGNILKSRKKLTTKKEKNAFGIFDLLVLNIKKLIEKLPGGKSRLASYAAALYLIREWNHFTPDTLLTEDLSESEINDSLLFLDMYIYYTITETDVNQKMHDLDKLFEQKFVEETPTVSVGSGAIAGAGVGPQGEPGLTPAQMKRYKDKNKRPKRKLRDILGNT